MLWVGSSIEERVIVFFITKRFDAKITVSVCFVDEGICGGGMVVRGHAGLILPEEDI